MRIIALIINGGRKPKIVYTTSIGTLKCTQKLKIFFLCFFSNQENNRVITCVISSVVLHVLMSGNLSVLSSKTVIS